MGAAARKARLSQPSVSARMSALERSLGMRLLSRSTVGSALTAEGRLVVEWAGEVLRAYDVLLQGTQALREQGGTPLRVFASQTVSEFLAPRWLARARERSPAARTRLTVGNSRDVVAAVRNSECDLGFIESPAAPSDLVTSIVAYDELVLVAAAGHEVRVHDIESLRGLPLITREAGSGTRETLERAIGALDAGAVELSSNSAIKVAVMAGDGYAVLSRLAVRAEILDGRLVELPLRGVDLGRPISAVLRPGAPSMPTRDRLVEISRQDSAAAPPTLGLPRRR